MVLGNTLNILRPPDRSTPAIQTMWNDDLVKNMHKVLGEIAQQVTAQVFGGLPEGTSRPASVKANGSWLDITSATAPIIKLFDGTDDITVMTFDYSANTVSFPGVLTSFDLVDDTSPQLGGDLDLNGNVITGLEIGTDIQAFDATLTSLAAVVGVAGDILFASGTDVWARLAKGTDGQVLTLASGLPVWEAAGAEVIVKTADQIVNNSTTLEDDDHLVFAMAADTSYWLRMHLVYNQPNNTPDLKFGWVVPSGCTMFWDNNWENSSVVVSTESDTLTKLISLAGDHTTQLQAIVRNGSTAGNLQFQWSQNTAHGSDTKIFKHSHMIIRTLGAT